MVVQVVVTIAMQLLSGEPGPPATILRHPQEFVDMKKCTTFIKSDVGRAQTGQLVLFVAKGMKEGQVVTITPVCQKTKDT